MMGGYGNGYYGGGGGGGLLGGIIFFAFGLLVLVVIVLLIVWAVRTMSGQGHDHGHSGPPVAPTQAPPKVDEACTIARTRYASGEISKEQYEEICKTLGV